MHSFLSDLYARIDERKSHFTSWFCNVE